MKVSLRPFAGLSPIASSLPAADYFPPGYSPDALWRLLELVSPAGLRVKPFMPRIAQLLLAVLAVLLAGCGLVPNKIALSDPKIAPLLQAIAAVDRASLGFTAIPTTVDVRLESRAGGAYDAMLHIHGGTSRTIAFRKTTTGYEWIHEQEIHTGPKTYVTPDGTLQEQIVITYETTSISGRTPGKLDVQYHGEDGRLAKRRDLTLDEVRPILAEWKPKR